MKFYVAGMLANRPLVQEIYKEIHEHGHELVLDWTVRDDNKPYVDNQQIVATEAEEMINCLIDLDVIVVIGSEIGGRGMYVEFGASLMHYALHGKPHIFIVGPFNANSAFYFHPAVKRVDNSSGIWEALGEVRHAV